MIGSSFRSRLGRGCPARAKSKTARLVFSEHRRAISLRSAFTLIEMLVVIVVLGVLAALVAPNVFRHVVTSKRTAARAQIQMLAAALDSYRLDNGRYPTTRQGLGALWREPVLSPRPSSWRGPYLRKAVPLDPWKNPYIYLGPGEVDGNASDGIVDGKRYRNPWVYGLVSYGADGEPGGTGDAADIKSWK